MPNFQGGTQEFYAYVHARPDGVSKAAKEAFHA